MPQGLSLDKNSGVISGTTSEDWNFPLHGIGDGRDFHNLSSSLSITMSRRPPAILTARPNFRESMSRADLANTPAPGSVIAVAKGGDFQLALNSAKCGDTITLQAGASFTGSFMVPAQTCDDSHWIIVRTSAPDSSLPGRGHEDYTVLRRGLVSSRAPCLQLHGHEQRLGEGSVHCEQRASRSRQWG